MQLDQKQKCHVTKVKTAYTVIPTTARIPLPLFAVTWFYFVSIETKRQADNYPDEQGPAKFEVGLPITTLQILDSWRYVVYVIIDVSKQRSVYIRHYVIWKCPLQFTAGIHEDYPIGR